MIADDTSASPPLHHASQYSCDDNLELASASVSTKKEYRYHTTDFELLAREEGG